MVIDLRKGIAKVIARVGDLPAMPGIVAEVLRITDNPDTDMAAVSAALEKDPALTAKILRVSNSPYYGMRQYVGTLKLALVILGVREVRNIVLGVSLFDSVRDSRAEAMLAKDFWDHSFAVGGMAKKIGQELRLGLRGEDFIAGLLHDIGKMVLCRQLGDEYGAIYRSAANGPHGLCAREKEMFGFTHAEAAAALAEKWNLPQTLRDALLLHHPTTELDLASAKDPKLAAVIRIANQAVYDDFDAGEDTSLDSLNDDEAWAILDPASALPREKRRAALTSFFEELDETPPQTI